MASSSSLSMSETAVFEGFELSEANNILLMYLMEEEIQEDDQGQDHYYADDRLISMIQSLEAEISSSSADSHQFDIDVGQMDGQDCSTSLISVLSIDDWMDMEVVSACSSSLSSFDEEMMSAWIPCAAGGDDSGDYNSEYYYGVFMESYLPQEASDVVF